jgi:hypothetical protein
MLRELEQWVLEQIRDDDPFMGWLEERRFDFVPPVHSTVQQMMEGATIILVTDHDRKWFSSYILQKLNDPAQNRPMLPIVNLESIYPHLDAVRSSESLEMIEDMLSLSYGDKYFFWYVGKGADKKSDLAKRNDRSMLWVMDEEIQNSFLLDSFDKTLDLKLLHLYRLFDTTLSGALFGAYEL